MSVQTRKLIGRSMLLLVALTMIGAMLAACGRLPLRRLRSRPRRPLRTLPPRRRLPRRRCSFASS